MYRSRRLLRARADFQYSRSYYRATYINTALDAGFSSAMAIRPKWIRDISSLLFTGYYLIYSNEADEVVSGCHFIMRA